VCLFGIADRLFYCKLQCVSLVQGATLYTESYIISVCIVVRFLYCILQCVILLQRIALCTAGYSVTVWYRETLYELQLGKADCFYY
jgi:hypothetical protein